MKSISTCVCLCLSVCLFCAVGCGDSGSSVVEAPPAEQQDPTMDDGMSEDEYDAAMNASLGEGGE